jgi:hypothetical protein
MKKILFLTAVLAASNLALPAAVSVVSVSYAQEEPEPKPAPKPAPKPDPESKPASTEV